MIRPPRPLVICLPVASALVDSTIFTCEAGAEYEVTEAIHDHSVAGSDGSAVTLDLKKCTGTQAPASGATLLTTTWDLKSTANTPVTKSAANGGLVSAQATRILRPGERLAMDFTGTLTALAGFSLALILKHRLPGTNR